MNESLREGDREAVAEQIGRAPRGLRAVAHRCPCGLPSTVQTAPRLEDGTPFPTLYYATCPRLTSRIGRLEADGLMRTQTERLGTDPEFAAAYTAAHRAYLAERDAIEPLGTDVSAGGMPDRVKCLHVHVAHTLAAGPGVNPVGDETLALLPEWWTSGPCVGGPDTDEGAAATADASTDATADASTDATAVGTNAANGTVNSSGR